MKKLKLYLAHNFNNRYEIKKIEDYIEKNYNIELLNPFFDQERNDLVMSKEKNRDKLVRKFKRLNDNQCEELVERDLNSIRKNEGLLSIIYKASIGTPMEIITCAYFYRMPVYIITNTLNHHPWLRYMAKISNGKIFKTIEDFCKWLNKKGHRKVK
jgi:hypothetical protein